MDIHTAKARQLQYAGRQYLAISSDADQVWPQFAQRLNELLIPRPFGLEQREFVLLGDYLDGRAAQFQFAAFWTVRLRDNRNDLKLRRRPQRAQADAGQVGCAHE